MFVSYFLGVYFSIQGLRNYLDRPLLYRNESVILLLTIIFGWIPTFVAVYLSYKNISIWFALILIVVRFIILPTFLNDNIKKIMDKNGF